MRKSEAIRIQGNLGFSVNDNRISGEEADNIVTSLYGGNLPSHIIGRSHLIASGGRTARPFWHIMKLPGSRIASDAGT